MFRMLKFLKPYRAIAIMGPVLMLIEVGTDLLQPMLMARIIDQGIAGGDISYIMKTGLLMIGTALIGVAGSTGSITVSSFVSQSFGADLRAAAFEKVLSFSFSTIDRFKTASLVNRLTNDIVLVQQVVMTLFGPVVRGPFLSIGAIMMTVAINARLASIVVIIIPILGAVTFLIFRQGIPLFSVVQAKLDHLNTIMRENLAGVRVVKAFNRSEREKKRFNESNEALVDKTVKASRVMVLTMPIHMLIMNFSVVAIIWFGGLRVKNGNMMIGEVAAFINYSLQILFSLLMVAMMLMMFSRSKASADRINEVLQAEVEMQDGPDTEGLPVGRGQVHFVNVAFQFLGGRGEPVLKDINFSAEAGETVAVIGGTGSGKSSLVHLIPRLYDVTEGQVLVDGRDVRSLKLDHLLQAVSVVLQETILFSGTVRENIRWGKTDATDEEVEEAAKLAQAHDFIESFPQGYDTVIGQRGVNLSGGQKQRLAIARALVKQPAILILDDSTSSVDVHTESKILAAFRRVKKTTTFIVAQRINTVMHADKIIVLEDGRIAAAGSHDQLLTTSLIYRDIYRSQNGEGAAASV